MWFEKMAQWAGFRVRRFWTDSRQLFVVYLLEADRVPDHAVKIMQAASCI